MGIFDEYKIKDMELNNRIVMPPMCMDMAEEGYVNSFHLVHYATRAVGQVGLIILEATGVQSVGRITDYDLGIWKDDFVPGLKSIVMECRRYGSKVAIQLGHSGRKSEVSGEEPLAPSPIPFNENYRVPRAMTIADIKAVVEDFKQAARRCKMAGFDAIELHGAHGYLINEFLSPLINKREDEYGGCIENRARFLIEVVKAVREEWDESKPLILRVSAEEYAPGGNSPKDIAHIINLVKPYGIDMVDVSTGAVVMAKIHTYPGYQIKHSEIIKEQTGLPVIGGGLIADFRHVEEILENQRADLVFIGRELLRNPYFVLQAARGLGEETVWPKFYERGR